jgi:hypothetical protein
MSIDVLSGARSFAPLGLVWRTGFPTACAVGFILSPLRGCGVGKLASFARLDSRGGFPT